MKKNNNNIQVLKQIGTQHRTFTAKMLLVPTNFFSGG